MEDFFSVDEIQDILQNHLGVTVSGSTINNYKNWGLLGMEPESGSGRLTGRWVRHPRPNIADIYAACILLNGKYGDEAGGFFGSSCPRLSPAAVSRISSEAQRQQEIVDNNLAAARRTRKSGEDLEQLYDKVVAETHTQLRRDRVNQYGVAVGNLLNAYVFIWYDRRAHAFKVLSEIGK